MTGASLEVEGLSWGPGRTGPAVLHETSFSLPGGDVLGIVGPNGAGKTTLLRSLYRYQRPRTGQIRVGGEDIWSMPARQAARRVAAVLQEQPTDFALTVREIVALGRVPHRSGFGATDGARDRQIADDVLARLDLFGLAERTLGTLSGGERQRVMVARALAQEPQLLILDEPTNHLDIRHQLEVLALIRDLPLTIVTSLHDLNMAAGVCDQILLLKGGRPVSCGPPDHVLTEAQVTQAFDVQARRERLAPSDTTHMTFHLHSERS